MTAPINPINGMRTMLRTILTVAAQNTEMVTALSFLHEFNVVPVKLFNKSPGKQKINNFNNGTEDMYESPYKKGIMNVDK